MAKDDCEIVVDGHGDGLVTISQFNEASDMIEMVTGDAGELIAALMVYVKKTDRRC